VRPVPSLCPAWKIRRDGCGGRSLPVRRPRAATFDPACKAHLNTLLLHAAQPQPNRPSADGSKGKKGERSTPQRHSSLPPSYSSSAPQITLRAGSCSAGFSTPVAPAARSWGRQGPRREFCWSPFFSFFCHLLVFFSSSFYSFLGASDPLDWIGLL
jgi:hypothetical protein